MESGSKWRSEGSGWGVSGRKEVVESLFFLAHFS